MAAPVSFIRWFAGMNLQGPSNIQCVIAGLCLSGSLCEASIEERNVVPFIAADATANLVPCEYGNPELRFADDEHRLLALIVPEVLAAEFAATNLQYVRTELLSQSCKLT